MKTPSKKPPTSKKIPLAAIQPPEVSKFPGTSAGYEDYLRAMSLYYRAVAGLKAEIKAKKSGVAPLPVPTKPVELPPRPAPMPYEQSKTPEWAAYLKRKYPTMDTPSDRWDAYNASLERKWREECARLKAVKPSLPLPQKPRRTKKTPKPSKDNIPQPAMGGLTPKQARKRAKNRRQKQNRKLRKLADTTRVTKAETNLAAAVANNQRAKARALQALKGLTPDEIRAGWRTVVPSRRARKGIGLSRRGAIRKGSQAHREGIPPPSGRVSSHQATVVRSAELREMNKRAAERR